ncbi:MAG: RagB/SusD family nutrient uptake outer membrane protein [Ferruginibacter sp.]|nr:RagB/SusD family nutrient uptake outer membrane protein [Ferruginibacter sp.]
MQKIFLSLSILAILISGCAKKLDILPLQSVDETLVFTSDANIKAALNGAYDAASSGALLGGGFQNFSELLGADGEINWVGTFNQPDEVFRKEILTNNSFVLGTYLQAYRVINICNNIIASVNIVNEADRDAVKGQALFLRGLMYFELVKLYAKPYSAGNVTTNLGLQLITKPTLNGVTNNNNVPRSTVKETYDQIIADLTAAKSIIGGETGVYGSETAVSAVLSRVYLQTGDYAKARDEASDAIENSTNSLESDYAFVFNNTFPSSEDIYVLPITSQDGVNDMHTYWSILQYGARDGDIEINSKHLDLYEPDDARLAFFYVDGNGIDRTGKWRLQYKFLPVIRLAEMYLTRSECNARLSTSVGATPEADLDIVRSRSGLGSTAATVDNIVYERRLELAHEGQRIHDIKRLQGSSDGFSYDANELVLPIPLREINSSAGVLKQNPGYE